MVDRATARKVLLVIAAAAQVLADELNTEPRMLQSRRPANVTPIRVRSKRA